MGTTTAATLSPQAIDQILDTHFRQEAEGDVEGTLRTLTDDVIHNVVGDPAGELHGLAAVGTRYGHLFSNGG